MKRCSKYIDNKLKSSWLDHDDMMPKSNAETS